jgi:hypothetical protein
VLRSTQRGADDVCAFVPAAEAIITNVKNDFPRYFFIISFLGFLGLAGNKYKNFIEKKIFFKKKSKQFQCRIDCHFTVIFSPARL